jgi:uncharacterized protein YidB (DUF937 family)
MGLLDSVIGMATGALSGGQQQSAGGLGGLLANPQVLQTILGMMGGQQGQGGLGGLGGLIGMMQNKGLGDVASSWVGTGQNMPISADQLQNVLGSDMLGQLAGKLGMSQGDAASSLSQMLPDIVNQMTPNGQVSNDHQGGFDMAQAFEMLKGGMGK